MPRNLPGREAIRILRIRNDAPCSSASVNQLSEPEFFDSPTVKLQQIMSTGATQNINDTSNLLLTFHRDIDDVLSVAQRLLMIVQGGSFVRRLLCDPQQPGSQPAPSSSAVE
jgi:hypothetical protein